ncbi:hypothetical protein GCM10018773_31650 [Streptomyces candidus]|nr:hypothetical protein GCM10018773_31650 [Streptomyces candidus]
MRRVHSSTVISPRFTAVITATVRSSAHAQVHRYDGVSGTAGPTRPSRIRARDGRLPAVPFPVPLQDLHGGRFARPVGSEQREHLAAPDVQVQPDERAEGPRD